MCKSIAGKGQVCLGTGRKVIFITEKEVLTLSLLLRLRQRLYQVHTYISRLVDKLARSDSLICRYSALAVQRNLSLRGSLTVNDLLMNAGQSKQVQIHKSFLKIIHVPE